MTNFDKLKRDLTFAQFCELVMGIACEVCPARSTSCSEIGRGSCTKALLHWASSEYEETSTV
jgi:hypothetical protein